MFIIQYALYKILCFNKCLDFFFIVIVFSHIVSWSHVCIRICVCLCYFYLKNFSHKVYTSMTNHRMCLYRLPLLRLFYHILYKDRDHTEAERFMYNLTEYLNIPEQGKILDLACGKGRHATYLNQIGYNVIGADLSENSINHAKQFENDTLHFKVHDMCKPFGETFDAVFNLFTSFGYFENETDNLATINAIKTKTNTSARCRSKASGQSFGAAE